jgi:LacI family transcriptional regulator
VSQISTIRDVAERAGVSIATVSNYLNDTKPIASRTRARIESAISDLRFVPNSASRIMRGGRNAAVGFVALDAPDPFFVAVARGIEDVAREAGAVLVLCNSEGIVAREKQYVEVLASMRIMGAVVAPAYTGVGEGHLDRLRDSGASIVLLGADASDYDACGVSTDDVRGGRLAMEHLIGLGHRSFVFVGGPGGERQMRDRFGGALAAVAEAGIDPSALRRVDAAGVSIAARAEVGGRIAALPQMPTAVFCASDSLALAVAGSLSRLGVRVPDDIAIVGYNNIDQTELAPVPITTVALPQYEIGRTAAQMLLSESEPEHTHSRMVFQPRLIARESTIGR